MSARRGPSHFALRKGRHEVALHNGETLVGRSSECAVVLDGALVSRRHALLSVSDDRVFVHDLESRNGTAVNGERIKTETELHPEDILLIGDVELQLISQIGTLPRQTHEMRHAPTMAGQAVATVTDPAPGGTVGSNTVVDEPEEKTKAGHSLELLASVIEKFFALGKGAEAKRLLEAPLNGVWKNAMTGRKVEASLADRAADFGVRLAEAIDDESWVVKVLDIFDAQQRPLPLATIDRLYTFLRHRPGEAQRRLALYIQQLKDRRDRLSAAEAFALKRLEGLLRVASL